MYLLGVKWYLLARLAEKGTQCKFFSVPFEELNQKNTTGDNESCKNYQYLYGGKKIQAMLTKQDPWYLLGILFKIFDSHSHSCNIGNPLQGAHAIFIFNVGNFQPKDIVLFGHFPVRKDHSTLTRLHHNNNFQNFWQRVNNYNYFIHEYLYLILR